MPELKPCPFCGNKPIMVSTTFSGYQIYCSNTACFMNQNLKYNDTSQSGVIDMWNKRVGE